MVLIKVKETKINGNGQVAIPSHYRRYYLPDDKRVTIYQTRIDDQEAIVIIPTNANLQKNSSKNLEKIQEKP